MVLEIWAKKWSKSGQIEVPERFFEKISRNMTDTYNANEYCCRELDCAYLKKIHYNRFSGSGVMVKIVTDLGTTRSFMKGRYFLRKSREI